MTEAYKEAGVDIDAGERAVELMKASIAKTRRKEVVGDLGGFAGLFDASALKGMHRPLLATSTDGVGTKTDLARKLGKYDTIGEDLVAMVVDDLVVCGAEPLFMTDYIAVGKVFPERVAQIVSGIARGCEKAGVALVGGETAEHPGLMAEDEFDLAGAATGVVDEPNMIGAHRVKAGDILIAMPSSGFHANGFSLVRHIIKKAELNLDFDGLIIESHIDPDNAWSDAKQQITPEVLKTMLEAIRWRKEDVASAEYHAALEKLRQQINQLDDELLQVLSTRMKVAEKIGEYKKNNDITILQTNRWNEILGRAVGKGSKLGLSEDFITRYMDAVHMESINHQNKIMNK